MRPIDADELLEHAYRDKLDSRELIANMIENAPTVYKGGFVWVDPKQVPLSCMQKDLFLAYIPGWNVCVSYWRTGSGWRRFNDNETIHPELVAKINLPK